VESVERVTGLIAEIEASGREQAAGIEQINIAVSQMDQGTQSDAQMAQLLADTAANLRDQSEEMMTVISSFSLHVESRSAVQTDDPRVVPIESAYKRRAA